ncbi:MAG: hypothetical protein H7A31_03925 [Thermotogae bacterium]|nr:hypothetical protein [Thermotogota bacterium]MCP5465826.1 hypothetical protein [Thermotogota bacterium]
MKKILLTISIFILIMAVGFAGSSQNGFKSNADLTLDASVTVRVYQWIAAGIYPRETPLDFQYYANWSNGSDGNDEQPGTGEFLGSFSFESNEAVTVDLSIVEGTTSSDIYSAFYGLKVSKDNSFVQDNNDQDKSVIFAVPYSKGVKEYGIYGSFLIGKDFRPSKELNLEYKVVFSPSIRF